MSRQNEPAERAAAAASAGCPRPDVADQSRAPLGRTATRDILTTVAPCPFRNDDGSLELGVGEDWFSSLLHAGFEKEFYLLLTARLAKNVSSA